MSQSSPARGLISTVVIFVSIATGSVYAIRHRDILSDLATRTAKTASQFSSLKLPDAADKSKVAKKEPQPSRSYGDFELKANENGHFETPVEINGSEVDVMIDTGATLVALTYEDAERAGLSLDSADFTEGVNTANGTAKIALVTLDSISIGDITLHHVKGAVTEPGKLHKTLLGMSFLGRLSRVEMRPDALVLHE